MPVVESGSTIEEVPEVPSALEVGSRGVLERSLAEFAPLVEAVPIAILTVDTLDRVTGWNRAAEQMLGWRAAEILGHRNPLSLPGPGVEIDPWRHCLVRHEPILDRRVSRRRRDGTYRDLRVSAAPVLDAAGEVVGAVATLADVTAESQAEEFVDRYRLLTGMLQDPVLVTDAEGGIVDVNPAAARMYEWSHGELLAMRLDEICCGREACGCPVPEMLARPGSRSYETTHRRKDGATFPVEVSLVTGDLAGDRVAILVVRDITSRRRREAARSLLHDIDRWLLQSVPLDTALESTCRRLAAIFDLALVSISLRDDDGQVRSRARGGSEAGYLDGIVVRADDSPEGQGPIGRAIREGRPVRSHPDTDPAFAPWRDKAMARGLRTVLAVPIQANGTIRGALALWSQRRDAFHEEEVGELTGFGNQVSVSLQAAETRETVRLQSVALDASANAVVVTDAAGIVRWTNPAFTRMTGWEAGEAIGRSLRMLKSGHHGPAFYRQLWETVAAGSVWRGEIWNRRKDGELYAAEMTVTPVRDDAGRVRQMVAIQQDVTARKHQEERIRHLTTHDPLTGLPNRFGFEEALGRVVARSRRGRRAAIVLFDIDDFRATNDLVGHGAGDEILCQVAHLLRETLRPGDLLARIGGDEFAAAIEGATGEEAEVVAERVRGAVHAARFGRGESVLALSVSAGVAVVEPDIGPAGALGRADAALYAAKAGRNRVVLYDPLEGTDAGLGAASRWAYRIKEALREGRFVLHFQPVVRIDTEAVEHSEVLLRMRDEEGKLLPPAAFLPAAERFGLMPDLDRFVVERVIATLSARPDLRLFVNLSGWSLADEGLLAEIEGMVRSAGIRPGHLVFEITETAAVHDLSLAQRWMRGLRDVGCRFALDDFGTGFSSFSYLQALPADFIKIDGAFVRNIDTDPTNRALVQALHTVARTLGKEVIAECVETASVGKILADLGVDHGQGFLWGRPDERIPR